MNTHELPMILFTVIAQLSVGTFIALGIMDVLLSHRNDATTVRRITEPVLYAIGPALVLGLLISMLHMNDVLHVFNVVRHWDSSWLSREILFGMGFAGLGFLFAILSWFRIGSDALRRVVGLLTALVGIGLVSSMSMIYYSLVTVPAWNTPIVPFHFFLTTIILGALAAGCALMWTVMVRGRNEGRAPAGEAPVVGGGGVAVATKPSTKAGISARIAEINAPTTADEWKAITQVMQWIAVVTAVGGILVLISYPVHISALAAGDATAQASAAVFSGTFFVGRMLLLALATVVLALFGYRLAGQTLRERPQLLVLLITTAFVLATIAEIMGRSLHYDSMFRVGI
ncbi:MAG: dimethyl sulfoxide reductase anchor subunit [Tessaracoccus sp.]|uniref:dimethyl sulfoxide reductase anchor subunit family protein n=1 Tax=Tessaracoccus sp. TaxID=1971211 RepID=UPI001EC7BBAE|nr:DmsC/YnfH family molybdoenzyme membrane anchor subunit [Tessaracoccus sp.]MBK7822755.1 dimethyl sulfoxide reductase anchor subunit [Tessaracoccus sp.]